MGSEMCIRDSIWSFSDLKVVLGMQAVSNPYITLAVTLLVGVVGNIICDGEKGYFKSERYRQRVASV